jgi:acyl transferase domain-containing protein/acyl carrier protein
MANSNEPIAIIGMACKFPGGASNKEKFWQNLLNSVDAICPVPKDRWDPRRFYSPNPDKPGKCYVKKAGFLQEKIDEFDPMFFGISPREAAVLDPQQRFLLEASWEAIEDAGLQLSALQAVKTGVFVGGFCLDHKILKLNPYNKDLLGSLSATSSTMAILSNRISYVFDFTGPSFSVDTACSSSLVATHLACESILRGESDVALVGGVNIMKSPEYFISMCKGGFLSKHGYSKAFDEDAEGYARGEGVGIIVLKPLSKAIEDKDYIYALIRGTGINQDGHTDGIALPNGNAQQALIRQVYKKAGVSPAEIDYIEAHGTGTQAGDYTEVTSLNAVLSEERDVSDKVLIGSVKTNIGHLEAGAGVAGMIKTALCLDNSIIPPSLHFNNPNPKLDFERMPIKVADKVTKLSADKSCIASINSFGYGGTNAHAVLQAYHPEQSSREQNATAFPIFLPFSAKNEYSLKQLAENYSEFVSNNINDENMNDFVYSLMCRRNHLSHRLGLAAESKQDLIEKLNLFSEGDFDQGINTNVVNQDENGKLVFVYTGMGPQWHAMGRQLFNDEPIFRQAAEKFDRIFIALSGWSLLDELQKDEQSSRIAETQIAQPANLLIQMALTELLASKGIFPDAVVGHSVGEVAAAYAAGALNPQDAILISYHRSRLQQSLAGQGGGMLAVGLSEEQVQPYLSEKVDIAAANSPSTITLSGELSLLESVAQQLEEKKIFNKFLKVEVAYHSYQMLPIKAEFLAAIKKVKFEKANIPWYSTVLGKLVSVNEMKTEYWWENVRQPVCFAQSINSILDDGYKCFLEVGPHPVLAHSIKEILIKNGTSGHLCKTLHRKTNEKFAMANCLAELYVSGINPKWECLCDPEAHFIKLPGNVWHKERYWSESKVSKEYKQGCGGHPLLDSDLYMPLPTWQVEFNDQYFPWVWDHKVEKNVVMPGAAYIEAGLAVAEKLFDTSFCLIEDIRFYNMLLENPNKVQLIQTRFDPETQYYQVFSCIKEDDPTWTLHARGRIHADALSEKVQSVNLQEIQQSCQEKVDKKSLYHDLAQRGLEYGPCFQTIQELYKGENRVLVKITADESVQKANEPYVLHPSILDATFQSLIALLDDDKGVDGAFVPVAIKELKVYASPGNACWAYCRITDIGKLSIEGEITITDKSGKLMVQINGLKCQAIGGAAKSGIKDWLYEYQWIEQVNQLQSGEVKQKFKWLVFGNKNNLIEKSLKKIEKQGIKLVYIEQCKNDLAYLDDLLKQHQPDHIIYIDALIGYEHDLNKSGELALEYSGFLIKLVQAIHDVGDYTLTLDVITSEAVEVIENDSADNLAAAMLWGLGEVIENEWSNITARLIDIDETDETIESLTHDLINVTNEHDIAYRHGKRFVRKLEHVEYSDDIQDSARNLATNEHSLILKIDNPGTPDNLLYYEQERRAPGENEVEIQAKATALNFKDLLKVYGKINPDVLKDTYFGTALGVEMSGVITRIGSGVKNFKVGDAVTAFVSTGAFQTFATIPTTFVLPKPDTVTFQEAPNLLPYTTSYRGLIDIANISAGDKVLIHNAAGGVGLSAIDIAKWKGAEIYTTAGSNEKREYLRSLGIKHIYDSRSLKFADEIKRDTQGYGVDVVINAIAGPALYKSLELLAPYGYFIEIGKKDIIANNGLPMGAFNRNVVFAGVDIDRMLVGKPAEVQRIQNDIINKFSDKTFHPAPVHVYSANKVDEAFRYMADSKHIGKIVIEYDCNVKAIPVAKKKELFVDNASYLITGGTSGFGLEVAKWMAQEGAKNLILLSRSGVTSEEAKLAINVMQNAGCNIHSAQVDVTDLQQINNVITEAAKNMPPLKGVVHGAAVLDDSFIVDMSREKLDKVVKPKLYGAVNLHQATIDIPLDFFIMFSSISSLIGNPGQANYVLGNSYLDAFAHYRHALGLPATTINWGVLAEAGMVARDKGVAKMLKSAGITGFSNKQAFKALRYTLEHKPVQIGLFQVEWEKWAQNNQPVAKVERFSDLVAHVGDAENKKREEIVGELIKLDKQQRKEFVQQQLKVQLSKVLKVPVKKMEVTHSIKGLGIDSLMAYELVVAIRDSFGVEMTTVELLQDISMLDFVDSLLSKLITEEDELLANIEELSEEEIDKILKQNEESKGNK